MDTRILSLPDQDSWGLSIGSCALEGPPEPSYCLNHSVRVSTSWGERGQCIQSPCPPPKSQNFLPNVPNLLLAHADLFCGCIPLGEWCRQWARISCLLPVARSIATQEALCAGWSQGGKRGRDLGVLGYLSCSFFHPTNIYAVLLRRQCY